MRARMALYHAGIQCEVREVSLREKPAELLAISAKATVPVLQLSDGRVIDESLDIMHWALAENDAWLDTDHDAMADLIQQNDCEFKYHLDRYKYPQRYTGTNDGLGEAYHFAAACDFLSQLEERLTVSVFLFGESSSMADVAIFPFVRQFAAVNSDRFDSLAFSRLIIWLNYWLSDAAFQQVMLKHKAWELDNKPVFLLAND